MKLLSVMIGSKEHSDLHATYDVILAMATAADVGDAY